MNLLFISEYFPPIIKGGGEINLFLLAKSLVKRDINVFVLTSYQKSLPRKEIIEGITVFRTLKTGNDPGNIFSNFKRSYYFPNSIITEIRRIIQNKKIDLIHFIGTSIIAAQKLKPLGIPLFATIESYPCLCPKGDRIYKGRQECRFKCTFKKFILCQLNSPEIGKIKNKIYLKYNPFFLAYIYYYHKKLRQSLGYCNLIAISRYMHTLLQQYGKNSIIIPNALEIEKFSVDLKKKQDKQSKKKKILYLGSLTKFKGPQILLEAIKGLDCKCELYGDGPLKKELRDYIFKNRINAEIKMPVPYEQVPQLYAAADIVVFPSIWPEPFGRIAIEAIAAGKPVIGSAIGGIQETISLRLGILVKAGNVEELQKAILIKLNTKLNNNYKIKKYKALKKYSPNRITSKLIKLYSLKNG